MNNYGPYLREVDKATDLDLRLEHTVRQSILLAEQVTSLVVTDELDAARAIADRWSELQAEAESLTVKRRDVANEMAAILGDSMEEGRG
jgi:ABC-type polar amino acid transport system ATPase subunit